jgi:hypothetical protein
MPEAFMGFALQENAMVKILNHLASEANLIGDALTRVLSPDIQKWVDSTASRWEIRTTV